MITFHIAIVISLLFAFTSSLLCMALNIDKDKDFKMRLLGKHQWVGLISYFSTPFLIKEFIGWDLFTLFGVISIISVIFGVIVSIAEYKGKQ